MFRIKFPTFAINADVTIRIVSTTLSAWTLAACAPHNASSDNWRLTPPTIELSTANGTTSFKANEFRSGSQTAAIADDLSVIRFAPQDIGLEAGFKTRCIAGSTMTEEHSETLVIQDRLSLLAALPPELLSPIGLERQWICEFRILAKNGNGSQSGGSIRGVTVHLGRLAPKLTTPVDDAPTGSTARRLICPTWWSEGNSESLGVIAMKSQVHGIDSRRRNRRPLCSVMELGAQPKLIGSFRPKLGNATVTASAPRSLLPIAEIQNLYQRKLFSWTFHNSESFPITAFIPANTETVRLGTTSRWKLNGQWAPGRTNPIRVFPLFSQNGGLASRQTGAGFYVGLPAYSNVTVEMSGNRNPLLLSAIDFNNETIHLTVELTAPMLVETLSNQLDPQSLATMDADKLDSLPRDPTDPSAKPFLTSSVWEPNRESQQIVPAKMSWNEMKLLPSHGTAAAIYDLTKWRGNPSEPID